MGDPSMSSDFETDPDFQRRPDRIDATGATLRLDGGIQ
ncbi:hypothetical protein QFZ67_005534 [Streptomyces sp. V1I1]|nr:hypothetical protein [Streptomyces sp. V1I1]